MPHTHLNLEDFPDSAYAQELRRNPPDLRFKAPLEAEYTAWHLQRVRLRAKVWFALTFVLAAFFTIIVWPPPDLRTMESLLQRGIMTTCIAVLAAFPWSRQYQRYYMTAGPVLVTIFYALVTPFIVRGLANGQVEQLAILAVDMIAIFFFCGLMFRQNVLTALIILIAFAAAGLWMNLAHAVLLKSMLVLTLTGIIGAIIYHDVERSYRRNFLEGALLRELLARDELTGLKNRRAFDEHLQRIWQHAVRDQRSLALLMIDVDLFKRYNDVRGHQAGDAALRRVARVIQDFARRPLDLAARYGGEEFAVILYDLAPVHVQEMAERLCLAVQNLQLKLHDSPGAEPEVTVSIGVGLAVPTIGRTPQGAIQLADEALYEAKQSGRNRVVVKGTEDYRLLDTGAFKAPAAALRER